MTEKSVTEIFRHDYDSQDRVVADWNRSIGLLTPQNPSNYWPWYSSPILLHYYPGWKLELLAYFSLHRINNFYDSVALLLTPWGLNAP
jgi:hypothetical protein